MPVVDKHYIKFQENVKNECEKLNEESASQLLDNKISELFDKLANIEINNPGDINDLALTIAIITRSAAQVAASTNGIDVSKVERNLVEKVLEEKLSNQPEKSNLKTILDIDEKYKPTHQAWANSFSLMYNVSHRLVRGDSNESTNEQSSNIIKLFKAYKQYLEADLQQKGIEDPSQENAYEKHPQLITRYNKVANFINPLENQTSLTGIQIGMANLIVQDCFKTNPEQSELLILNELQDLCSPHKANLERKENQSLEVNRETIKKPNKILENIGFGAGIGLAAGIGVGAVVGALVCFFLIPIPGVGSAVGAVIGGFIGAGVAGGLGAGIGAAVGYAIGKLQSSEQHSQQKSDSDTPSHQSSYQKLYQKWLKFSSQQYSNEETNERKASSKQLSPAIRSTESDSNDTVLTASDFEPRNTIV